MAQATNTVNPNRIAVSSARVRRVIAFLVNGRREYAAFYDPLFTKDTADLIEDLWPQLRERGRVAIIVETDGSNVVHFVRWCAA